MNEIDILTIGDSAIDQYMFVEDAGLVCNLNTKECEICFKYDSKIPVKDLTSNIAGNASNVAIGAASLGLRVAVYTIVGDDGHGEKFHNEYKKRGIITDFVIKDPKIETDVHTVIIHEGERTIFSYHGDKHFVLQDWPKPKWIYYTSMCKDFQDFQASLVNYLTRNPDIAVAFNPGTYHFKAGTKAMRDILKVTSVLFVNDVEAGKILESNEQDVNILHKKLQEMGPKITVITKGVEGSSAYFQNKMVFQEAKSVEKLVDKTGAGDSFAAGVISALCYNKPLQTALLWGAHNSANVIQKVGSVNGHLSYQQVKGL